LKEDATKIDAEKEYQEDLEAFLESQTPKGPLIGMTASEVRNSSWGEPKDINRTMYSWGTTEQWCYSGYRYIYFRNGIVTAISE